MVLPFLIPGVSICYGTQSDVRVKIYYALNFLRSSVFNIESIDIFGTQLDIREKSYCRLILLRDSILNFERLDILWDTIGHPSKRLLSFEFAESFCFQV